MILCDLFLYFINQSQSLPSPKFFLAGTSNPFTKGIAANVAKAKNAGVDQQVKKTAGLSFLPSILSDLKTFLNEVTNPLSYAVKHLLPIVKNALANAFKDASKGAKGGNLLNVLLGLVGGLSSGLTTA